MDYKFIGWCSDGKHDKVWGVIELIAPKRKAEWSYAHENGKYCTFWGRRGKKLQTKIVEGVEWDIQQLVRKKLSKGYDRIEADKLNEVYPEFEDDLNKTAVWATLMV